MNGKPWILLDTETTGLTASVFVVELAAQRMRGWGQDGEPFHKLLNQNQDIPAEASRVHGYTREILERDGEPPLQVYRGFADYAGCLPFVSFNLEYDLDEVLKPEWKRLRRLGYVGKADGVCGGRMVSVPDCLWNTQGAAVPRSPSGRGTAPLAKLAGRFFQRAKREDGPLVFGAT